MNAALHCLGAPMSGSGYIAGTLGPPTAPAPVHGPTAPSLSPTSNRTFQAAHVWKYFRPTQAGKPPRLGTEGVSNGVNRDAKRVNHVEALSGETENSGERAPQRTHRSLY